MPAVFTKTGELAQSAPATVDPPFEPGDSPISLTAWADHYNVQPALVPFAYRSYDTVAVLRALREALTRLPETVATFRLAELDTDLPVPTHGGIGGSNSPWLLEVAGAWRYDPETETANRGRRWVNPYYVHARKADPNITDADARLAVLERAASYGVLTLGDIAPRFGIKRDSLGAWVNRRDFDWQAQRREGYRRLCRTAQLIIEWTDYTIADVAAAVGMPTGSLSRGIYETVHQRGGFDVPPDPSAAPWFTGQVWARQCGRLDTIRDTEGGDGDE